MLRHTFLALLATGALLAQTSVLTGGHGNSRANANLTETVLTPANVRTGTFNKLFSLAVDGAIYAQPLYLPGVTIPGKGTHNVVFVATMHNTVYAFDSDQPGVPLWNVNLGPAVPTVTYGSDWGGQYADILPENGVLSTPVIDPTSKTMYVVAATREDIRYIYRLHALDIATGQETMGAPSVIAASVPGAGDGSISGAVPFRAEMHLQRPALLLANNTVYVAFGAHADAAPYHGWIMGYSAANVQLQTSVFNSSPNGSAGAIWQAGRGLAADSNGSIYAVTSNGTTDETYNFSDNVLRLDPASLRIRDWFAPSNVQELNDSDDDLGACGAILIDGTNYLITGGKDGVLFLLDTTNLGKATANDSGIVQRIAPGNFGIFNLALWNRADGAILYVHTVNGPVTAYRMVDGKFTETPVARSVNGFNIPYQGMTVSANGSTPGSGILWILTSSSYPLPAHAVLRAYEAESLDEIWNSDMSGTDGAGVFVKFVNPTVADGKVFVATATKLEVYGLGGGSVSDLPVVTSISNVASYSANAVAPGEMVAIQGTNLGPADIVVNAIPDGGTMSTELAGTQVLFNGIPGPVFYTSSAIVTAIVPFTVSDSDTIRVQLAYNGKSSTESVLTMASAAPGVFAADSSGSGPGSILNPDYTLNTPENPAETGSVVVVYATGGGRPQGLVTDGAITAAASPLAGETTVTVNGVPAEVLYAGNAGGIVAGIVQLNIRLPEGAVGDLPVVVTTAGIASQATVTVSVK